MDLKDIASVNGKAGLFKILKPTRTGVILETIDEKRHKLITNVNYRVSILKEISIYTTSPQGSEPLGDVLLALREKHGDEPQVGTDNDSLMKFIEELVPDYDRDRVYPSDIKKLLNWYGILVKFVPETFADIAKAKEEEAKAEAEKEKAEETVKSEN